MMKSTLTILAMLPLFLFGQTVSGITGACDCFTLALYTTDASAASGVTSVDVTIDGVTTTVAYDISNGTDVTIDPAGEETIGVTVGGSSVTIPCERGEECLDPTANVAAAIASLEARFVADSTSTQQELETVSTNTDLLSLETRFVADSAVTKTTTDLISNNVTDAQTDATTALSDIAAETTARSTADAALTTAVTDAQTDATTALSDIAAETTARSTADAALQDDINDKSVSSSQFVAQVNASGIENLSDQPTTFSNKTETTDITESGGVITFNSTGVYNVRAEVAATYTNRLSLIVDIELNTGLGFTDLIPRREGYMARNASHNDGLMGAEVTYYFTAGDQIRIRAGSRRDGSGIINLNDRSRVEIQRLGSGS